MKLFYQAIKNSILHDIACGQGSTNGTIGIFTNGTIGLPITNGTIGRTLNDIGVPLVEP